MHQQGRPLRPLSFERSGQKSRLSTLPLKVHPSRFETAFVVLGLCLLAQGFFVFAPGEGDPSLDPSETRPVLQALFVPIYLVTAVLAVRFRRAVLNAVADYPSVWLLIVLATLSIAWSEAPEVTTRRSIALIGTSLFGTYLAVRFSLAEQLRVLSLAVALLSIASLFVALYLPEYGVAELSTAGDWRGVFTQKNTLGRLMTLGIVVAMLYRHQVATLRWRTLLTMAVLLEGALLFKSGSATGIVCVIALALAWPLLTALKYKTLALVPILVGLTFILSGVGVTIVEQQDTVFQLLGRDPSLTGRTRIWDAVAAAIQEKPFLGYGFGGFWLGWDGASSAVWEQIGWASPHSHNGILDLALDLGAVGVLLFLLGLCGALFRAIHRIRNPRTPADYWPIAFLLFMFFYNITESTLFRQGSLFWTLYVATTLAPLTRANDAGPT